MPIEIIVPRLGWSMEEGAFVAWLKQDGEFVRANEPLFSIEGDKAVQEIESLDSGILRIAPDAPKPGGPVRVGDVLGHLLSAAEVAPGSQAARPGVMEPSPPPEPRSSRREEALISLEQTTRRAVTDPVAASGGNIVSSGRTQAISPRALRVAAELGVDWTAVTGTGRTGRIRERDIRAAACSGRTQPPAAASPARSAPVTPPTVP